VAGLLAIVDGVDGEFFSRLERTGRQRNVSVFLVLSGAQDLWGKLATDSDMAEQSRGGRARSTRRTVLTPTSTMLTLIVESEWNEEGVRVLEMQTRESGSESFPGGMFNEQSRLPASLLCRLWL